MSTALAPRVPADARRVDLRTPSVAYWTGVFAGTAAALRAALLKTGSWPAAVPRYLAHERLARYPFPVAARARRA